MVGIKPLDHSTISGEQSRTKVVSRAEPQAQGCGPQYLNKN